MIDKYTLDFAKIDDLSSWMDIVTLIRYNFPSLEIDEELEKYRQVVIKNINRKTALCVKDGNSVVGILIFSYNQKCLGCMGVHPNYRRQGIASAMIEKMLSLLPNDEDVWVVTFRENDEKGIAPRALYKSFGFVEDELVFEQNYPNQKFILHRK